MFFIDTTGFTLQAWIGVFAGCALVIGVAGTRLTGVADVLADRTGLGEAITGAVLLGATTSLAGSVLSVTAAWQGYPELSMANAIGGIAAQTAFLAVADIVYRRANLEHAAASAPNMMQGALLCCLLAVLVCAPFTPNVTVWGIHPVTPILLALYVYGLRLTRGTRTAPMWRPRQTDETRPDLPEPDSLKATLLRLLTLFVVLTAAMGVAGVVLQHAASRIAALTGISQTVIGGLLTSVSTSLPELVTSIAAVRRGALTLAVGGIIGGNAFDTLFAAFSDVAYRSGSIYHAVSESLLFLVALTILMTGVLLMGLIHREERGIGRIGFESAGILILYVGAVCMLIFA